MTKSTPVVFSIPVFSITALSILISVGLSGCQSVPYTMPNTINGTIPNTINGTNLSDSNTSKSGYQNIFTLQTNMCFDDPIDSDVIVDKQGNETVGDIAAKSCDAPHDNEIYYTYMLANDAEYQNASVLKAQIEGQCKSAFEAYMGQPITETSYGISYIMPTQESWQIGEKEVLCFAYDVTGAKLTESLSE